MIKIHIEDNKFKDANFESLKPSSSDGDSKHSMKKKNRKPIFSNRLVLVLMSVLGTLLVLFIANHLLQSENSNRFECPLLWIGVQINE